MEPLFITGFMGTGKSSVGRCVASLLGFGFMDLDEVIVARAGRTIRAIFDQEGEAEFRRLERELLESLLGRTGLVIATGGGTLVPEDAMSRALSVGRVVCLETSVAELLLRLKDAPDRPLWSSDPVALERLLESRRSSYARAHLCLPTGDRSPEELAALVAGWYQTHSGPGRISSELKGPVSASSGSSLEVPLGERRYRLEFSPGGRRSLGRRLRELFPKASRALVVTNPRVGGLYFGEVEQSLLQAGIAPLRVEVPDSESAKSMHEVERLLECLCEQGFERREPILALGGGVVGDLAGFVASIYLRGVPFVQVPTTLLAQVDSSIGGKTGIDNRFGKNLVGSFFQPAHVLMDVEVLQTLHQEDFLAGMAEVIKYGVIRDHLFFEVLERHYEAVLARDPELLQQITVRSCLNKAEVVIRDERETGERALLNFGHTLGHAFETLTGYQGLRHGHAVAIGMAFAARLSDHRGICSHKDAERLVGLLRAYGLPTRIQGVSLRDCLDVMRHDKKVSQGMVRFVMMESVGSARLELISFGDLEPVLERFLEDPA